MAKDKKSATGTSNPSVEEIRKWSEQYAKAKGSIYTLRDITKNYTKSIQTIDKETLKTYIQNIGGNEKNLRNMSRYLYYRSNIYSRIVSWYADMFDLRCRKVIPKYDLTKDPDAKKMLKSYNSTLDMLDLMNMQGNIDPVLKNVFTYDVCFCLTFMDDTGMFFYILDPDDCIIDGRYSTGDFSFSINMANFKSAQKQSVIEFLGSPLKEMYAEYQRDNSKRYVHVPDEYAFVLKFRSETFDLAVPPCLPLFLQLAGIEDLVDIQAEADGLSIYKLLYMPMDVISGSKMSDDFEISPDLAHKYFRILTDNAIPDGVAAAMVPGKELKVIDFAKTTDSDVNSVEKANNALLQTAGGGAVINSTKITTNAGFEAWLKAESEYALSPLIPQINGFVNRMLLNKLGNSACRVEHFEVSVYTKEAAAKELLSSAQYSYPNRLAYNTFLGISEKETLAMLYLENEVLGLPDRMKFPLSSSFTSNGTEDGYTSEIGQGAPKKDTTDLTDEGDRSRSR